MFVSDAPTASQWASLDTSDHSSRTWEILIVNGIFLALVLVVILLRIGTKISTATRLFLDDYLMLASASLFTTFCALNIAATTHGFGAHIWDLPGLPTGAGTTPSPADLAAAAAPVQQLNYAALAIAAPVIMLGKLSVLAVLLRVFPVNMAGPLRALLYGLAAIIIGCCGGQALLVIFQCWPVRTSWDLLAAGEGEGGGRCVVEPLETVALALGALNVATDLVICLAPIPRFLRLKIETPQKACLCALFLSGLIACAVSIARVLSLRGLNNNLDVTYAIAPYLNWSVCEGALIIMTGSIPSLRPLLATILPHLFRSSYYSNISSLFASEKRATMMRPGGPPSYADTPGTPGTPGFRRPESSSVESLKGASMGMGAIVITKEYHIEAMQRPQRPGTSWPSSRPTTPTTRFAPRAIVTCGKAEDV